MRIVLPQESFLLQFVWGHTTTLLDYKRIQDFIPNIEIVCKMYCMSGEPDMT